MSKQIKEMAVRYKSLQNERCEGYRCESSLDRIFSPGCYVVEIGHADAEMGLPIEYCGEEHYIIGNLFVTDCGTMGPKQHNRVTGQVLVFTTRVEKATKIYTRTFADGEWGAWRALAEIGMFDDIASADELVASVQELVSANKITTSDISMLQSAILRYIAENSFTVVGIATKDILECHEYIRNVSIEILPDASQEIDLSSIALCLLRKGFTEGYAEIRWSALVGGARKYIFGEGVLINLSEINREGHTHIEQENLKYGLKIAYDVNLKSPFFPKTKLVFGSLEAVPSMVVSHNCIKTSVQNIIEDMVPLEQDCTNLFAVNKGYYFAIKEGLKVPAEPRQSESLHVTYAKIDVVEGMRCVVSCSGTKYVLAWAVADAGGNILVHSGNEVNWGSNIVVVDNCEILIPEKGKMLIVNNHSENITPSLAIKVIPVTDILALNEKVAFNLDEIDALNSKVDALDTLSAVPSRVDACESKIATIEERFTYSYNSLFTENEGGYIKIDSVALAGKVPEATTESTAATYAEIDVLEGETYDITARGSSYVAAWAVIDADRKVLSHVGFAEGSSKFIEGIVVERVVIPAGAARLIVNKVAGSTIPSLVKVVAPIEDIPTLYQKVADNKVAVDNAVDAVEEVKIIADEVLTSMSKSYAELFEQNRGTYYNIRVTTEKLPSNPVQTDLGFTRALIPVVEGERYNIVAKGNQNFVAWATADADKKIMRRPETASADNVETTLSIEKNECFLLVNSLSATFVPSLVKVVTPIEDISVLYQKAADSENILSAVAVLKGKKILCLGDSITEFRGYAEASTTPTGRYSDYLAEKTGAAVYNGGIGAAHMEQRDVLTLEPSSSNAARAALDLPALADALATGDWNYQDVAVEYLAENADDDNRAILAELKSVNLQEIDVVTIFIGTNDYTNSEERMGAVGDTEPLQNSLGGFGHAVKTLLTANPKLRIFYFSPMVRYFGDLTAEWDSTKWSDNMTGVGGIKFTDMVDKMIENAAHWKIPVCDMYRTLGINEFNIKSVMTYNGTDGTHPRRGNKMLANKIASFIVANNCLNV